MVRKTVQKGRRLFQRDGRLNISLNFKTTIGHHGLNGHPCTKLVIILCKYDVNTWEIVTFYPAL